MTDWRRVSTNRNYEVSDDGRVRRNGRELKGYVDRYGYRTVLLYYGGLSRRYKVHRLVCDAFKGPCPVGLECAHLDGNQANNSAINLAWVTRVENMAHNTAHGKAGRGGPKGDRHPSAKLSKHDVIEMRRRAADGESGRHLAKEFGILSAQASAIIRGDAWKHLATPCAQSPSEDTE